MFTRKENTKTAKGAKNGKTEETPTSESPVLPKSNPIKKENGKSKITIKYDVGFPNQLYIRGQGANLSWDKGIPFKNVKPDEWVWETDLPFNQCEFKVLINDRIYENGENRILKQGTFLVYTPKFY